jgi:hypothetical protein
MISSLIPGTVMLCRDHLYDAVQRFLADGTTQFYNDNERRAFIETMIDVPDGNVLSRYALFLDEALRKGSSIASAAA